MPLMTRLRSDPPEYRKAYLGLVRRLCVFLMPLSVTFAFTAVPLTRMLLGDRWHTAGLVLTALAPALAFMGIAYAVADLFITQDRSAELRNLGLFELVVRVGAISLGATIGLIETAAAFTLSTMLVTVVRTFVAGRRGPVTAGVQLRSASAGLLPALGAAVLITPVFFFLGSDSDLVRTVSRVMAGILGAFLGALLRKPSREAMAELAESFGLGRLVRRRAARATA
jgi:PST family polysaccharide transporter